MGKFYVDHFTTWLDIFSSLVHGINHVLTRNIRHVSTHQVGDIGADDEIISLLRSNLATRSSFNEIKSKISQGFKRSDDPPNSSQPNIATLDQAPKTYQICRGIQAEAISELPVFVVNNQAAYTTYTARFSKPVTS